jgi:hypothetical protein
MVNGILAPETAKRLRDAAGQEDLLWLVCDSHELLRAERDALRVERDHLYDQEWPWEWVVATREKERREAAEAERDEAVNRNATLRRAAYRMTEKRDAQMARGWPN